MARVKRFIYNSDFMTLARVGHKEVTVTIPARKSLLYAGVIEIPMEVPSNSFTRYQIKYQASGAYAPLQWLSVNDYFLISDTQNGRQIVYTAFLVTEKDKLNIFYYVIDMSNNSDSILINSQTFTLIIDFLTQPNT